MEEMKKISPRLSANRRNAARSSGPKNTISTRFNATKHGLLADGITELDDRERYEGLCHNLRCEFHPQGTLENFLVRRVALGLIRVERAAMLEARMITQQLNPAQYSKSPMDQQLEQMIAESRSKLVDPGIPVQLASEEIKLICDTFGRYETANENRLFRSLSQLERLQSTRKGFGSWPTAFAESGVSIPETTPVPQKSDSE